MMVRDGYKMTELGVVPAEWEVNETQDICHNIWIGLVTSMTKNYVEKGVKLIRNSDIKQNKVRMTKLIHLEEGFANKFEDKKLREGDIVTVHTGDIGTSSVISCELDGAHGFATINSRVQMEKVNNNFLCWFYNSNLFKNQCYAAATGDGRDNLNLKDFINFKVILPSILEQEQIAEILSTNDDLITKTEQLIEKTRGIKQGLMQELLTKGIGHTDFKDSELGRIPKEWEVKNLGDVLKNIIGGGTPSREVPEYFIGDIPWATVKDLDGHIYKDSAIEYINDKAVKDSSANVIPSFNVIVATRMGLGRGFINKVPMAINQDLKALIPMGNIDYLYLLYWFLSNGELIVSMGTGSTVKGIRLEELKNLKIPVPSIEEQRNIVSILMNIDNKIDTLSKLKQQLQEIKQGLMQDLLTGRVRVV